ncbi:YbaB/EbfC family nucleoid-associated protein [Nonomuraea diastatica]|uniref:YbaB/EbfC family DNA-binding protein n=1 Tax=Nonomuraea diastatica TaxID=1848329 RepID=A0A4R4WVU0_9ACTN|nr:YbaB/EbfC family nucleoid-associated protein [Nonomuraea diastatica]TDD21810.1 YbaB/EbfC family DNA-binding protein [Nonomuraea diastatica]
MATLSGQDDDREIMAAINGKVEQMVRESLAARDRDRVIAGVGESDDGMVRAKADADGAIVSLALDPRVMRRDADRLAEDVAAVLNAAQRDAQRQAQEILDGARLSSITSDPLGESLATDRDGRAVSDVLRRLLEMSGSGAVADEVAVEAADEDEPRVPDFLEKQHDELESVTGTGANASGQVTATADAHGRVREISIGARAMRLDSHVLAEGVLAAVRDARRAVVAKAEEKVFDAFPDLDAGAGADAASADGSRDTRR